MASSSSHQITPELLEALMSPDAGRRQQAETVLQGMEVVDRVRGLVTQLQQPPSNPSLPLLTAVLLRRDVLKLKDSESLGSLVEPLLAVFLQPSSSCRTQVGHVLAEVCASLSLLDVSAAGGKMQSLIQAIQPGLSQGDLASFQLLAHLADRSPVVFAQVALPSLSAVLPQPSSSLPVDTTPSALVEVWTDLLVKAAVATTVTEISLVSSFMTPPCLDALVVDPASPASTTLAPHLKPILEYVLAAARTSQNQQDDMAQACLQDLALAAVTCPSLVAGQSQILEALVQTCLELSQRTVTHPTSTTVPLAALEVLSSLISVGDIKRRHLPPAMAQAIGTTSLQVCAKILVHANDDDEDDVREWAQAPAVLVQEAMDDDNDDVLFAASLAESFLGQLGALSVALPIVEELLASTSDWKKLQAGLMMLECALTATPVSLTPHLSTVVTAAATFAKSSPNPRVQYHALRLLGALCQTHPQIRESASQALLEPLAGALANPCTKVSAIASLGLVSYCRGDAQDDTDVGEALAPFMSDLLGALVNGPLSSSGTDTGSVTVRVRAMGATACLAEATGEGFAPFYSRIMPGLLATAQLPVLDLVGASVEAATIVGQAVGKEVFGTDSQQLLSWILPALQSETPILEQLLSACARIAAVLEKDFAPYLSVVLPLLLQRAQAPPDISVVEGDESGIGKDEEGAEDGMESMTVPVPGRGFTKVTINTTKIQEKAQATRAVYELAKTGAAFGPYAETCLEVFLPLVNFPYSADVRSTSAQTLGAVFDAACVYGDKELIGMDVPQKYLPLLTTVIAKQIAEEDTADMEALYALADSLSEVLYIVHTYRKGHPTIMANYTLKEAQNTMELCMKSMVTCLERRSEITRVLSGSLTGDDEKEEYVSLLQAEQQLLTPLVDSVGYNVKLFHEQIIPLFEQYVVPVLGPALTDVSDVRASVSAVLLYDDVMEHCGTQAAAKFSPSLLQGVLKALETSEKDLVQAAVYGIAQMARNAPTSLMSGHIQTIVHRLVNLTNGSKDEAGDNVYLVEIATSALASLTLFGPFNDLKFISRDQLVDTFLRNLPIQQDYDEAKICHENLCRLVENGGLDLASHVGAMTRIIGTILQDVEEGEDVATPDTVERLTACLYQLQQSVQGNTLQQAFAALEPEAQQTVTAVMAEFSRNRSNLITP